MHEIFMAPNVYQVNLFMATNSINRQQQ